MKRERLLVLACLLTCAILVACSPSQPAGKKIAYTSAQDGNPEIYVMNHDGSGQTRLTNDPEIEGGPAWSP